jgi:hypothetical protein
MVDKRRPMRMRGLPCAAPLLFWLSFAAFACTTGTGSSHAPQGGAGGGSPAVPDASTAAGNQALPPSNPTAGAGGAAALDSGSASLDGAVSGGPIDAAVRPADAAADTAPPGPGDAAPPPDAAVEAGPPASSFCPLALPEFDTPCFRENLSCTYGMECCPDLAFCEFGRWTLLTHHCDACVDGMPQ